MSIFTGLPKVDYCCLCFSLKWGSILIAFYTMISFAACVVAVCFKPACGEEAGTYKNVMDIATYVMLGVNVLPVLASLVFLFGIIKSIPETATLFMFALAFAILINIAYVVMAIVFSVLDPDCPYYTSMIAPAISVILWLYFILVVNSYEEKMLD